MAWYLALSFLTPPPLTPSPLTPHSLTPHPSTPHPSTPHPSPLYLASLLAQAPPLQQLESSPATQTPGLRPGSAGIPS